MIVIYFVPTLILEKRWKRSDKNMKHIFFFRIYKLKAFFVVVYAYIKNNKVILFYFIYDKKSKYKPWDKTAFWIRKHKQEK